MTTQHPLTVYQQLAKRVTYDPKTGILRWLPMKPGSSTVYKSWNSRMAGKEAGTINPQGYVQLTYNVNGHIRYISAHRLAWVIAYGVLPAHDIDHINGDRADNRLANLRDVPRALNLRNAFMSALNTSGVSGVRLCLQTLKWTAEVRVDYKLHRLGYYVTKTEAMQVVTAFRNRHSFTKRHGSKRP